MVQRNEVFTLLTDKQNYTDLVCLVFIPHNYMFPLSTSAIIRFSSPKQ